MAAAVRGKCSVPCVMVIVPPAEGGKDGGGGVPGPATLHLYRAGACGAGGFCVLAPRPGVLPSPTLVPCSLPTASPIFPSPLPPLPAEYLEGAIELDSACRIKKVSEEACLIFGLPSAALVGEQIQKVGGRGVGVRGCRALHCCSRSAR